MNLNTRDRILLGVLYGICAFLSTHFGVSGSNYRDPETVRMWDQIVKTALDYPGIIRVHSFHADMEEKTMSFAIV